MDACLVLVPKEGTAAAAMIDSGSAVVSDGRDDGGSFLVWFEGNRHGAVNLRAFHERAVCAAGRMAQRYPTIAKALLPRDQFIEVASFSLERLAFMDVSDPEALSRWAGEDIGEIVGVRLDPGSYGADWLPPQEQLSWLGRAGGMFSYRTRSGQALVARQGGFEVLADDDPRAVELFSRRAA